MIHFSDTEVRAFAIGVLAGVAIMIPQILRLINDTETWYKQGEQEAKLDLLNRLQGVRYSNKKFGELWRVGQELDKLTKKEGRHGEKRKN